VTDGLQLWNVIYDLIKYLVICHEASRKIFSECNELQTKELDFVYCDPVHGVGSCFHHVY
jgi:site-specific DNA-adenine methylase